MPPPGCSLQEMWHITVCGYSHGLQVPTSIWRFWVWTRRLQLFHMRKELLFLTCSVFYKQNYWDKLWEAAVSQQKSNFVNGLIFPRFYPIIHLIRWEQPLLSHTSSTAAEERQIWSCTSLFLKFKALWDRKCCVLMKTPMILHSSALNDHNMGLQYSSVLT